MELETINKEKLLSQQFDLLGHYLTDDFYTEIRNIKEKSQTFVRSKEEFIEQASKFCDSDVYVGINPRSRASGTALDVSNITCIVIDIDPVRPRGEASTEEQHKSAIDLGRRIQGDIGGTTCVSSGSGCHIYVPIVPIKVTNHGYLTSSLADWNKAIKEKYETTDLKVDSIFDLPRVIRIWGSFNTKSQRPCVPLGEPDPNYRLSLDFPQVKTENKPVIAVADDRFVRLVKQNERLRGILDGTIKHPSGSESDFEFVAILARAGYSEQEINTLVCNNPTGRAERKDLRSDIRRIMQKVARDDSSNGPKPSNTRILRDSVEAYSQSLAKRHPGISTGIVALDRMISGLKPGKLYIFAARPTQGKTTLITQILSYVASQNKTCLFYPTEVGAEPIWDKIISAKTGISLKKFQNGDFTPEDKETIANSLEYAKNLPLIIAEDFAVTPDKVEAGIKQYAPHVVCVDFLQTMAWNDPESVAEKAEAIYRLKKMALDYDIPFILASQLNRGQGPVNLSQLKGTGALEELGDVISFIHQTDVTTYPTPTDLIVMKSKYSATGLIKLHFVKSKCRFEVDETWKENE